MAARTAFLAAIMLASAAFAAPRPVGVVAHPDFSREQIRKVLGKDVTFFAETDLAAIRAFSAKGGRRVVA